MTIGIEATKAFEENKTGVGWYTFYVTRELMRLVRPEDELRLYLNSTLISNSKFLIPNQFQISKQQCNNVTIKQLSWPPRKYWTQMRLSIEMIKNPPDVLFIPAHLPPLIMPKKLVVTIHDLAFKQYPEVYSTRELRLQEWGIKRVLKKAWKIIVPSEFTKNEIKKYYPGLVRDNIYVIPHGVDHDVFKSQISNLKSQNHNTNLKSILYIGRLEHKKNIVNLIKAFNIIKSQLSVVSCQLSLIGTPGFGYADIKREIDASPYKSAIRELGWIDRDGLADHLNQADIFVLPSLYEGFGLPLLEAMACGTPIACSDIPPLREVGGDVPVYFDPADPQDIADKIKQLLVDNTLQSEKIRQGLERIKQFTWAKTAQKTWEIFITE